MPKRKIKLAASDGKRVGSNKRVSTPKKPQGGAAFQTYSLKSNLAAADFAPNWQAFFIRPGGSGSAAKSWKRKNFGNIKASFWRRAFTRSPSRTNKQVFRGGSRLTRDYGCITRL